MRSLIFGAAVALGACVAGGASAQERSDGPRIDVAATGWVDMAPEIATIRYTVRGEGATADDATRALVARKASIEAALKAPRNAKLELHTDRMQVREVRGQDCRAMDIGIPGRCAIQGYVTELVETVRIAPVAEAGTLTAAIAQAGGSDVSLGNFELRDLADARRRATAMALANGKAQAEIIAVGSAAKLGPLLRVSSPDMRNGVTASDFGPIVVTGSRQRVEVPVAIAPDTVRVIVQLTVSYELVR